MSAINIKNLSFSYQKGKPVLSNISFEANSQESIGLIGANGTGKSTLLKLLVGLSFDYEGTITVNGLPLSKQTLSKIRQYVGYLFQDSDDQLFTSTVFDDVAFAPRNYGYSKEQIKKQVTDALSSVNILPLKNQPIYQLSGGEKKLAAIATILSIQPEIILLDEPTNSLDPVNRKHVTDILNCMHPLKIIASHDLDFILDTCERTILLYQNQIIADGPTREILSNQSLLETHGLLLPISLGRRSHLSKDIT